MKRRELRWSEAATISDIQKTQSAGSYGSVREAGVTRSIRYSLNLMKYHDVEQIP